ncbi:MAG: peptidylprolyl isomerase [Methylococcaceae bacterium]
MKTLISTLLVVSSSMTMAYAAQPSIVEMQTSVGTITIQLNQEKAPITSTNFLNYVNSGFYKDTFFHRVVKGTTAAPNISIIQGGGIDSKTIMFKKTQPAIVNESNNGLKNVAGTISMARTADANSATSQFFFNFADNSASLDFGSTQNPLGYAVFGSVIGGADVMNKIGNYTALKMSYSEGVPVSELFDCGFNLCLKKIIIENIYTSDVVDTINSITRVSVNGSGKVTTSIPKSFSCTSKSKSCTLLKPFGTAISLIAKPSTGYDFKGWSGDCSGIVTTLQLDTATKNNNCTATFVKKGTF